MQEPKQLLVSAIKNGTVIDHIQAGMAAKLLQVLNLGAHKKIVTLGLNLPSKNMGLKDLIKIEDKELTKQEANRIAIFSPQASINIISNYEVTEKFDVTLPEAVHSLIVCPNPKCITNNESMNSDFKVQRANDQIKLQCKYCEKIFLQSDINDYRA